ncbi:unnamed protein product, partial [Brachionus calyciflorus]
PCISNRTFLCSDETCINKRFVCDGKRSCLFSEDEENCHQFLSATTKKITAWTHQKKTEFVHLVIITILGFVLSLIIISAITVSCKRSIYKTQNIYKINKIMNKYEPTAKFEESDSFS